MSKLLRLSALLSSTSVNLVAGTLYLYSAYGPQLALKLQYSGIQSSLVAFAGTIGIALSGVPSGIIIDNKGFTVSTVIGSLCIGIGYIGLKDQYDEGVVGDNRSNFIISSILIFLIGLGSTFVNSALIKCCAITFPTNRGIATSFPIASYGLSAFVYSFFGTLLYQGNTSGFLGFLGYSALVITALSIPFIYIIDKSFNFGQSVRPNKGHLRSGSRSPSIELQPVSSHTNSSREHFTKSKPLADELFKKLHEVNISKLDMMKNLNFWILFVVIGILVGLGQLYIYSVGFMIKALLSSSEHSPNKIEKEQQFQVSILSIANCAGRLLCGVLGDLISNTFKKPRRWILFIPCLLLFIVQISGIFLVNYEGLWILSVLNGLGYGFTWSSTPQILIEIFGLNSYSFGWGVINLGPIIPAFFFTHLFGSNYDNNLTLDDATNTKLCTKRNECYNHTFDITSIIAGLTIILIIWINYPQRRNRERYI